LEARHPFLDVRLVEFCLGIPWHLKTHRGWTKNIMRLGMQPYLPPSVAWRTDKDHLGFHFTLNRLKGQSEIFKQLLNDDWKRLCVYIDEKSCSWLMMVTLEKASKRVQNFIGRQFHWHIG
jgi:asparagine synthase (glutamine-hydrolysing)